MNYFGILDKEEIRDLSIDEIEEVLLEKEIYTLIFTQESMEKLLESDFKLDFDRIKTMPSPPLELINEFHEFIFKTYKKDVIGIKYEYFSKFNEDFFGLEFSELKKISLIDFNEIYENLRINQITIVDERTTENGIAHTHTTGKLFKLYNFQHQYKTLNASTKNIVNYLTADLSFYNKEFYEQNIEIRFGVHLEVMKQILVEINDKYNFEEDIYFSKKVSDIFKLKDYDHIFKNLKSYQFTNKTICDFKKLKRSYIESLYEVLLKFDLIEDHKENFIAFIKSEYKFILPKITTFSPKQNIQNDKRVLFLTQKWENYDVQKTNLDMFMDF